MNNKRFWILEDPGPRRGWFAAYVKPSPPYGYTIPLIGWALVEDEGVQKFVGIVTMETETYPATHPNDGQSRFVTYIPRGTYTDKQMDDLTDHLIAGGKTLEKRLQDEYRAQQSSGRDDDDVGQGRLLQHGSAEVHQRALQSIQNQVEGRGQGERPDPEPTDTDEVEEGV